MNKFFVLALMAGLTMMPIMVQAEDMADMNQEDVTAVEVGNKICPVSGEKVGEMGEVETIEHNGKIYNLCCAMCAKDFSKDPDKYAKIADDEVAANATAE
jgi:YHS domain-containing protein